MLDVLRTVNMSGTLFCKNQMTQMTYAEMIEIHCDTIMDPSPSYLQAEENASKEIKILASCLGTLLAIACVVITVLIIVCTFFHNTLYF